MRVFRGTSIMLVRPLDVDLVIERASSNMWDLVEILARTDWPEYSLSDDHQ